jgi:hypothetical protein
MNALEIITIIKDIIITLAAILASILGVIGLNTWRRELKGKSQYLKAKEILNAVYKVREAFKYVRNPAIFSSEYPKELLDKFGSLKKEFRFEGNVQVYESRFKVLQEAFIKLEELNIDAQVEWGSEFQYVIDPLRKCRAELLITIQDFLASKKENYDDRYKNALTKAEERSILYFIGPNSEHDKFTPEIDNAVLEFEKILRPIIKK